MDQKIDLKTILDLHTKWRRGEIGGSMADLSMADLSGAKNHELAVAMASHLPEGDLIGWKKCREGVIVKLEIPSRARRSHGRIRNVCAPLHIQF